MAVEIRELNGTNCKTYLLRSGNRAALLDPVRERFETYRRELVRLNLCLDWIAETHTHADHLMLNHTLKESLGAPLVMHGESPIPTVDRHVEDGDELRLGDERLRVIHTPGHTPDSICLCARGAVFTGDTLLIGGSGRTDFPGGDAGKQYDAVTQHLFTLPGDTVIWPAHDYSGQVSSTIAHEKQTNPRFLGKNRAAYITQMANLGLPLPDRVQGCLQVNQSGFESSEVAFPDIAAAAAVARIAPSVLAERLRRPPPPLIVDVREPEEFVGELGHIEGAVLVPLDALERRLPKLAGYVEREIVVVCRAGARSATAAAMLQRASFARVSNLAGGMLGWRRAGLPVQH